MTCDYHDELTHDMIVIIARPSSINGDQPRVAVDLVDGRPTGANELASSGRGPGCRKHQQTTWSDEDDEDCTDFDQDLLSSGDDSAQGHDFGPLTQTRLKTLRMENVLIARGRVRGGSDVIDNGSDDRHRGATAHSGRLDSDQQDIINRDLGPVPKTSTTSSYHPVLSMRTTVTWVAVAVSTPYSGGSGNDYPSSSSPLPTQHPPSPSVVKATVASPAQQRSQYPSTASSAHSVSSSSSLSLNIGLIIGIGSSVVILFLIAGYSVYRYYDGCLRGRHRGSYRLDTAAVVGTEHEHKMHMPIPSSGSSCGPLGVVGSVNGASASPLGGAVPLSLSKSNCKIPTKEWYV